MEFAVNYSNQAVDLLRQGQIRLDRFKCPAWPGLIETIRDQHPLYVHFPLKVGAGKGDAIDTKTGQSPDWTRVENLLKETDTAWVNLHLGPTGSDHPDLPLHTADPAHAERLAEAMLADIEAVVRRFGPERVVAENLPADDDLIRPALWPQVIGQVIEASGCGFLFDLAHARIAAQALELDQHSYIAGLPLARTREIHVTGVQPFAGYWLELAQRAGVEPALLEQRAGKLTDHLPMTEADWQLYTWAMEQVRAGRWGRPGLLTFEYGGIGPRFEVMTEPEVLAEQVPRLYTLAKNYNGSQNI